MKLIWLVKWNYNGKRGKRELNDIVEANALHKTKLAEFFQQAAEDLANSPARRGVPSRIEFNVQQPHPVLVANEDLEDLAETGE